MVVGPELFLKIVHHVFIHLESLGENIRIDWWPGPKNCICNCNSSWILAAQSSKSNCIGVPNVELKVNQTNWKHKNISRVYSFCNKAINWGSMWRSQHRGCLEGPLGFQWLEDECEVDSVHMACKINTSQRYTKSVKCWYFVNV